MSQVTALTGFITQGSYKSLTGIITQCHYKSSH